MTSRTPNARAASGNFIRVARDNWTLEESQTGKRFVPFGCNYYDAHTGWPPQVWNRFDPAAVQQDFRKMEDLGVNAIRVWLQWSVFMPSVEKLSMKAVDQCHTVLSFARDSGIRVNLTGPEFWEGYPRWLSPNEVQGYQHFVNAKYMDAHATFWELFAGHFAEETIIYGFDLANEPFMPWDGEDLRRLWNQWLNGRYGSARMVRCAWGRSTPGGLRMGEVPPPPNRRVPGSRYLVDYQTFREEMACRWTRNTVGAIRRKDQNHLITVGLHQSGCPLEEIIPSRYTAFNPHLLKEFLDYISLHWYPFGNPLTAACQPFDLPRSMEQSMSVFLANCRYSYAGKPLLLEECSYYGGGSPLFWGGVLPHRTENEQEKFSRRFISVSKGSVGGWLNWPLQDTEKSTDTSAYGGLYTATGELKPWGRSFRTIGGRIKGKHLRREAARVLVPASRMVLLTDWGACEKILQRCYRLHLRGTVWDFKRHTFEEQQGVRESRRAAEAAEDVS